ncbi:hypothetical protein MERGE_002265 [Pneumocystis wakefieldiae]|uniref:cysteine--tRNA ligase n=1 Tax=Pneumocystis wakefieldiae TaxID=38082 RepID=A0A899FT67_9ASCO|nr:hypothetical protein MERGE_002265 [Pneumocystis wakefieldiae]
MSGIAFFPGKKGQWKAPKTKKERAKLMVWNSLTRSKNEFVPQNSGRITWYCCGPTVYDWSHMGHARNYVTTDIVRRILQNYFRYEVVFVQNVTDIDDKIILKARHNYLFNSFVEKNKEITAEVYEKVLTAWKNYFALKFPDGPKCIERFEEWSDSIRDSEALKLDGKLALNFKTLNQSYEGVGCFGAIHCCQVINKGYAYESNGSVFFDIAAFEADGRHVYAKIEPWNKNNRKLVNEGEGELNYLEGKKMPSDFALWKASKVGEPKWDSPWGEGRPGWHIECSAMASEILGSEIDIHSGGIDLAFPHHDNEIAQSEAFFDCDQWVNYFFHMGHLHIEGQKMSKSLKNFITIQDALKKYTSRQMRLYFLKHQWNLKMDFKESFMKDVKGIESLLCNFFININSLIIEKKLGLKESEVIKYTISSREKELCKNLYEAQEALHDALCDNFNTPESLDIIMNLITKTNIYISQAQSDINILIITNIAKWISSILEIFGLKDNSFTVFEQELNESAITTNHNETIMPYVKVLSSFRDDIRNLLIISKSKSNIELSKDLLKLCDRLRDVDLTELGIQLEDRENRSALIKFVEKSELKEQQQKKLEQELLNKKMKEEKLKERILKGKLSPKELFQTDEYSKWDDQGFPLHDAQGIELTKSRKKKIAKEWEKQTILHEKYLDWRKGNAS